VREYARHVEAFEARSPQGARLEVTRSRKNRWMIQTGGARQARVRYRVYGRDLSVRTNYIEAGFASIVGAGTFVTTVGALNRPHEVRIELPPGWTGAYTGLPSTGPLSFRAPDFDTLVDCPIVVGSPAVHEFTVGGKPHYLVNEGEGGVWNGRESADAVAKIVAEYHRMMGTVPYDKYLFLNLLAEGGGGLEHKNSTLLIASRWAWRNTNDPPEPGSAAPPRPSRYGWLDLASHEYFHLWNVKRLRPVELGPFDYENENYTTGLWVAEGFTTYYGPLAVRRAGLLTRDNYLRLLSAEITALQNAPGRLVQSASSSSYNTWIKFYRPDENSANTSISYYTKGALIAWLLDVKIRRATGNQKNLDTFLRTAFERFSGAKGFTETDFRKLASEIAGTNLESWLNQAVDSTDELDYSEALSYLGLRLKDPPAKPKTYLGLTTRADNGRLLVATVPRETPAYRGGLNVEDEILAIDGYRVRAEGLNPRLEAYKPGDTVAFTVARRDRLVTLPVTLTAEPRRAWVLEVNPAATDAQKANLKDWLRE
jgi:predicted metalloprotease with PDZ domain